MNKLMVWPFLMGLIISASVGAQEQAKKQKTQESEDVGPTTLVVSMNQGQALGAPEGKDNVTKVAMGVEKKFKMQGQEAGLMLQTNIETNQGYSQDHIAAEVEGIARYGLVTAGPGDNFKLFMDLSYAIGYDKLIGFKGAFGTGVTAVLCTNDKEGQRPEWRLCWINNAKGSAMIEKAVWLEASTTLEIQKKLSEDLRIRAGARATASLVKDTEAGNIVGSGGQITGVLAVDWDFIQAKKPLTKSKSPFRWYEHENDFWNDLRPGGLPDLGAAIPPGGPQGAGRSREKRKGIARTHHHRGDRR